MYGDIASLRAQFGEAELYALAQSETDPDALDEARLSSALEVASSEADSYLAARYAVPLQSAPRVLLSLVGDIARYRLTGGSAQEADPVTRRYQEALDWLRGVAKGVVDIPGQTPPATPGGNILFEPGKRVWR